MGLVCRRVSRSVLLAQYLARRPVDAPSTYSTHPERGKSSVSIISHSVGSWPSTMTASRMLRSQSLKLEELESGACQELQCTHCAHVRGCLFVGSHVAVKGEAVAEGEGEGEDTTHLDCHQGHGC
jgi:hypothetical protein